MVDINNYRKYLLLIRKNKNRDKFKLLIVRSLSQTIRDEFLPKYFLSRNLIYRISYFLYKRWQIISQLGAVFPIEISDRATYPRRSSLCLHARQWSLGPHSALFPNLFGINLGRYWRNLAWGLLSSTFSPTKEKLHLRGFVGGSVLFSRDTLKVM